MDSYTPRTGTKARAVFDLLQDGQEHRWKECFEAYRVGGDGPSNPHYVSLGLGRVLKRVATRVRRGVYVRKLMEKNPCAEIPLPPFNVVHDEGPEPEVDEHPFGRKFKSGDRVRYVGGYTHYDYNGVPKDTVFTVDFYGAVGSIPVSDRKGYLWFKEQPIGRSQRGGHGDEFFELVPADESCGGVGEDGVCGVHDHGGCHEDCISEEMHQEVVSLLEEARSQCDVLQAQLVQKDEKIDDLQDNLTETAVKINDLERGTAQLEQLADQFQDDNFDVNKENELLREENKALSRNLLQAVNNATQARDTVIKNQLALINRQDAKLCKIQRVLDGTEL